jgi:hypothetical protein
MNKIINIFRKTPEKTTKRKEERNKRKKARQEQILNNKQMRRFYRERTDNEIRLRHKKQVNTNEEK